MSKNEPELTIEESRDLAARGFFKAIPYIGSALDHFYSGPSQELKAKRVEKTLKEIGEKLNELGKKIESIEEFTNLLESVAPDLCRATNEEKRKYFRNLLFNASTLPPGSSKWDDANFARELLNDIDPPGLALISAILHCKMTEKCYLVAKPVPHVRKEINEVSFSGKFKNPIPYQWVLVDEWALRLKEKRLIHYTSGGDNYIGGIRLTQLGRHFIDWMISDVFGDEQLKSE